MGPILPTTHTAPERAFALDTIHAGAYSMEFVRYPIKRVLEWVGDRVRRHLIQPAECKLQPLYSQDENAEVTIVTVPGFNHDLNTYKHFRRVRENYPDVDHYLLSYPSGYVGTQMPFMPTSEVAEHLVNALNDPKFEKYKYLLLVGDSMGGRIVQRALLNSKVSEKTKHVLYLATPFGGVNLQERGMVERALKPLLSLNVQASDLMHDSEATQQTLNTLEKLYVNQTPGFKTTVLWGDRDHEVPQWSALEPWLKMQDKSQAEVDLKVCEGRAHSIKPGGIHAPDVLGEELKHAIDAVLQATHD
jgi:pimeloyl-ACP methyl ester carboxylesterase